MVGMVLFIFLLIINMSDSESLSSPNDDSGQSASGQETDHDQSALFTRWMLRLTPLKMYDFEDARKFLSDHFSRFLICEELPKQHFHIVLDVSSDEASLHDDDIRGLIRSTFLDAYWPAPRPVGFGNKQYNLQIAKKPNECISYTLKQKGRKYFTGFTQEEIDAHAADSFPKNDRVTFVDLYRELKKEFHESEMSLFEFGDRFQILKSKFDQGVDPASTYKFALSALIKRDNRESGNVFRNYLESLKY